MNNISTPLQSEAEDILHNKGLLSILKDYGTPHISGSYALDLMVWRDLDIYLETEAITVGAFYELGGRIAETLSTYRMQFRNERIRQTPDLPQGLYWSGYFHLNESASWKLDIWCVSKKECDRLLSHCARISEKLTSETRGIILNIKQQVWKHSEYRFGFSSQDIYDAVLENDINSIERFREYLIKSKGINL